MADNNVIDSLELKVKGDANSAISTLDKLQTKLRQTAGSIKNLRVAVDGLSQVDLSFKNLNGVNVNKLTSAIDQLERLSNLKLDKLNGKAIDLNFKLDTSSTEKVAEQLKDSFKSLKDLGGIDLKANGASSFIASMSRLTRVDLSKFDKASLDSIVKSVTGIANVKNIETGVTRLVSALARLASAGENTRKAANALPTLGDNLKNLVGKIGSAGGLPAELVSFTTAISQLANAGNKTIVTAENLKALGAAVSAFISDVQGAPDVSDNIVRMTEAIGQIANSGSKAGTAARTVGKSITEMSEKSSKAYARMHGLIGAMKEICNIFGKAGSAVKQGALRIINSLRNIRKESNGLQTATQSIRSMIAAMIGFRGITGLGNVIKETVVLGANLTEIDHIVESVFGNMSGVVDSWAKDAITQFGIAEHSAKQYAGVLSSMFQSSNIGYMDAGKMSLDLVELAGDLSAFYNIDTETAFNKIRSGMAGMVRPLRDLGIDLTAATLEEFRLAQGIETAYSQMTQQEKIMLRYQYLMARTTTQQGDFQRTNASLANSFRTLQAYIQAVQTQLGVGLGAAIRHVIVWINMLMKYVVKAATLFASFMQTIFGKYKGGASGIAVEGLGDAAEYADDLGDAAGVAAGGLDDAADSARQLKKDLSVLPFDELNQLNKDRESASSGSSSGGAGGVGGLGVDGITDGLLDWGDLIEDELEGSALRAKLNAWATQLKKDFLMHDWEGLGRDFALGLNKGLQKVYDLLDPQAVKKKIDPWINAFTTTFNSFIDHFDFNLLGRTMGRGINDIVHIMNKTIEGINFRNLGSQIANGLNGMLDEVNFTEIGHLLGNKFMILWNTLNGFVHNFEWENLGSNIADLINGLNDKIDLATIADTIATGANGIFDALGKLAEETHWDEIATNISNGIVTFIDEVNWEKNADSLANFISNLCDAITKAVDDVGEDKWNELGGKIAGVLARLPWAKILKTVGHVIVVALGGILKGMLSEPEGIFAVSIIAGLTLLKFSHSSFGGFARNLAEAITGKTVTDIVKGSFQKIFKTTVKEAAESEAVKTASETAGKSIAKSTTTGIAAFGQVAVQLGLVSAGFAAAYFGITEWEKGIASSAEKSQGLNGVITEMGSVIDRTTYGLESSGAITEAQSQKLIALADSAESMGVSSDQMAALYVQALADMSVKSEDLTAVLDGMTGSAYGSQDSFWILKRAAEETNVGVQTSSSGISTSVSGVSTAIKNAVDKAKGDLANGRGDFQKTQQSASTMEKETGKSFRQSADHITTWQQQLSGQTATAEASIGKYKTSAQTDLNDNKSDFNNLSVSSVASMVKMGLQSATLMQIIAKTALTTKLNNILMQTSFTNMFNDISNSVDTFKNNYAVAMGGLGEITNSAMLEVKRVLLSYNLEMWRMGKDIGENVANGLKVGVEGIGSSIVSAMLEVKRVLLSQNLEMWRQGQAMGQSLANGFSSVYIPSPHLYVAYYTTVINGDGSWYSYPNWGVSWYRAGGLFKGGNGQLVGIAEDGRDEAVLPLEDRRAMARIGSAIADAGGSSGMSDDMVDKLARSIAEIMMASQDNREQPMNYIELKVDDEVLARAVTTGQQKLDYRNNPTPQMA